MDTGDRVEIYSDFTRRWVSGFVVCDTSDKDGVVKHRIRRAAEREPLPEWLDVGRIREDRP